MGRFFSQLLTLGVIVALVGFVGAPYVTFFALRSAAQSNDKDALSKLVDVDKVRASLREQVGDSAAPAGPPPSVWQDPIGALRRTLEPLGPAPQADTYLSPHAIAALTEGEGRDARLAEASDLAPSGRQAYGPPYPVFRYWGVNRTRLVIKDADHGETIFTLERKGLWDWKLVHVNLPSETPDRRAQGAPAPAPAR